MTSTTWPASWSDVRGPAWTRPRATRFASRRRRRRQSFFAQAQAPSMPEGIRVGGQVVHFAPEATKWLSIWLDSALTLRENRRRRIGRTRQAEARIGRIVNQYGVPPASARNLQMSLVQGTMLYAAELTWSGQKDVEGGYQRAINRMARSTLGVFRSAPQGILAAESGLAPARALLDHRQARFSQRLFAQPVGGGGPEEILTREGAAVTTRLRAAVGTRRGETVEPQVRFGVQARFSPGGFSLMTTRPEPGRRQGLGQPVGPSGRTGSA